MLPHARTTAAFPVALAFASCAVGPRTVVPAVQGPDLAQIVNPFIGTADDALTFPGAAVPFGMVQLSPDTRATGYRYEDARIRGFSHTHLSGVGCRTHVDIPFMPALGDLTGDRAPGPETIAAGYAHGPANEVASAGYYAVSLSPLGVRVELTATERTGWHRYTFPRTDQANVVVQVGRNSQGFAKAARYEVVSDTTVRGSVTGSAFCANQSTHYTLYFHAAFSRPFTSVKWAAAGQGAGGTLRFDTRGDPVVVAKVGISYVSTDNARANIEAETGAVGFDFDATRQQARAAWNAMLGRVEVTGGSADQRAAFYSALYRSLLHPNVYSDVNGQFRGADGEVHTASGYTEYANFSLWDTYRVQAQLLALVAPERARDMLLSLLDLGRYGGWLPKWVLINQDTNIMTGDPVTPFLVDGALKGLLAGREPEVYERLWQNANQPAPAGVRPVGRGGIVDYLAKGYVPFTTQFKNPHDKPGDIDTRHGASATLEYALADCALSLLAWRLGKTADREALRKRARNYRNLFDPSVGMFRPRNRDGSWKAPFNPVGQESFHEGSPSQYLWFVPQDFAGLVELLGGPELVNQRLDHFFGFDATPGLLAAPAATAQKVWVRGAYAYYNAGTDRYNPANQPDLQAPYVYLWTGQPWKTQAVVRAATTMFTNTPDGSPGNDDLGTMAAWYVMSALGLYPAMPGADFYVLASPLFSRATIRLQPGYYGASRFTIEAPTASETNQYVKAATLNGATLDRAWIEHETIRRGATLQFTLTPEPGQSWATTSQPPSVCGREG